MSNDPDTDDETAGMRPSRRQVLGGTAGTLAAALGVETSTAQQAIDVIGGNMALQEATNVAGDLYMGPPGSQNDIAPNEGRRLIVVDAGTERTYYADGSSWTQTGFEGPSVQTDEGRFKGVPWHDVTEYGAVGNGSTDDSGALQSAVDAALPHGGVFVPHGAILRLGSNVDIDGGETDTDIGNEDPSQSNRFYFNCQGAIKPDSGIAGLHVHNAVQPQFFVRLAGGGGSLSDYGLHVSETLGGQYTVLGLDYSGTCLYVNKAGNQTFHTHIPHVHTVSCGRSIKIENLQGFGQIGNVWEERSDQMLSVIRANDISIDQYENVGGGNTTRGAYFDNGGALWIDKLAVGKGPSPKAEIRNYNKVNIGMAYCLGSDSLKLDSVKQFNGDVFVGGNDGGRGVIINEAQIIATKQHDITLFAQEKGNAALQVGSGVSGPLDITVAAFNSGEDTNAAINIDTTAEIALDVIELDNPNASNDISAPAGNNLYVEGVKESAISYDNRPYAINQHVQVSSSGAPDATNHRNGFVVEDTANAGDVYYVYDDSSPGGVSQIGT